MQHDVMVRFSITKTDLGWAWKTVRYNGQRGKEGLAASKRLAAAAIIQEIVREACSCPPDGAVAREAA